MTKYCAHLHHTLSAPKRYFSASLVAPLPNSEKINQPSSNHIYTKSTPNHIHYRSKIVCPSGTISRKSFKLIHSTRTSSLRQRSRHICVIHVFGAVGRSCSVLRQRLNHIQTRGGHVKPSSKRDCRSYD